MVLVFKRSLLGLCVTILLAGLVAFVLAIIGNIENYRIIFTETQRNNLILVYGIYILCIVLMVSSIFLLIVKKSTGFFWTIISVMIIVFFTIWFPLFREANNSLLIWLTPSVVSFVLALLAGYGMFLRIRLEYKEGGINKQIYIMNSIFHTYWKLSDARKEDKSAINPRDGMKRKDEVKFYRIDYKIKEHDK